MRYLVGTGPGSGTDGTPIKLLAGSSCPANRPRLLFATIVPAAAQGGIAAGAVDQNGLPMHLTYTVQGDDAVPRTTYENVTHLPHTRETVLEFGPGTHFLNYPGELALISGQGLWQVDIQIVLVHETHLHWHWLQRIVQSGQSFTLPAAHNLIGSYNANATLEVSTGAVQYELIVGSPPVPVFGGATVTNTGSRDNNLWVYTGVYA